MASLLFSAAAIQSTVLNDEAIFTLKKDLFLWHDISKAFRTI